MLYGLHAVLNPLTTLAAKPVSARWRMETDMGRALDAGQFHHLYQSRHCLRTGRVAARDALLRWPDARRGVVLPSAFMQVAQRSDLANRLGAWALADACAEATPWTEGRVSVAASARQVQTGALPGQVRAALEATGLPPERLELELPEAVLMHASIEALLGLSGLRDLGVGLVLSGFGTGPVDMLMMLPLTAVKLHRSLTRGLPRAAGSLRAACTALRAVSAAGLPALAGGIETEEQRAFLSGLGCTEGSGELFGAPQRGTGCGARPAAPASANEQRTISHP